jgi:hypothetical protein
VLRVDTQVLDIMKRLEEDNSVLLRGIECMHVSMFQHCLLWLGLCEFAMVSHYMNVPHCSICAHHSLLSG